MPLSYWTPQWDQRTRRAGVNPPYSEQSVPIIPHTWDWLIIHTCSSLTHTHISHTHTQTLCEVLICPGCLFWALYPCLISVCLTLDHCLLFWLFSACPDLGSFSPELCLLAACPDPLPGTRPCLCLSPAVLPCQYLNLYCLTILIKICKWIQMLLTHHHNVYVCMYVCVFGCTHTYIVVFYCLA